MSNHLSRLRNNGDSRLSYCGVTLSHMSICTGVVVSVAFQQVDGSPDAEAGTEGDDESLENADSRVEKFHICVAGIIGC